MKEFSSHWKESSKVKKQRKFRYNSPRHIRRKLLSSHLSKELKKKYGRRSFELRKGDEVKIMRGSHKGKIGKVLELNSYKIKTYIEGIQISKKDGTKVNVPLDPSNLILISLNLEDKRRVEYLNKTLGGKK